jgi:hypothetical protein
MTKFPAELIESITQATDHAKGCTVWAVVLCDRIIEETGTDLN